MHNVSSSWLRQWLFGEPTKDSTEILSDAVVLLLRAVNRPDLTEHDRKLVRARGLLALAGLGLKEHVERALS